jgi:DnaJ-class molecular chaperone
MRECPVCKGTGKDIRYVLTFSGIWSILTPEVTDCSWCMGRGTLSGD